MAFNSPDLETFKVDLESNIKAVQQLKTDSHATIKIQSLLNITIYVLATRFLEGAIKHVLYNCCIFRGDNSTQMFTLESELKKINNPEYSNIVEAFKKHLNFDITQGLTTNKFSAKDIALLNEIVRNRHRNVHASFDSSEWYSKNLKDISNDFQKEYPSLLNILSYLDSITYDHGTGSFKD